MRKVCLMILAIVAIDPLNLRAQETAKSKCAVTFAEVPPSESKITWVHDNGRSESHHLPETCGGGGLFFDYDNDGWMDIYLVNSGPSDFFTPKAPLKNALYHNNHDGTFTDVTDKAGVAGGIFGMGAAAADYDGDGWVDLYVTGYGRNILYHNNGNGTFTDVTDKAGLDVSGWSTHAVWFDYDNDGKLDLFVSSFVEYSGAGTIFCGDNRLGRRYYCVLICVLINYCLKCPLRLCFATQPLVKNTDAKLRAGCQCPLLVGLTDDLAVEFDRFGEILIAFVEHAGSLEDLARILLPES